MRITSSKKKVILLITSVSIVVLSFFTLFNIEFSEIPENDTSYVADTTTGMFGIEIDSFTVITQQIKPNEFLADILLGYNVPYQKIHQLVSFSKELFNAEKMRIGDWYTVLTSKDSLSTAQYFIYQPNAIDYVVCDLRDTVNISCGRKKVSTKVKTTRGVIHSSLYTTLVENHSSPSLAMELANIYAWTIDFYGIQKGDSLKVIYEEKFVGDQPVGLGNVLAAQFTHYGKDYFAVYFEKDSVNGYFNDKGISMRKVFLKSPLKYSRITSSFTYKRFHPVQKKWKAHLGTDYAAPKGTPILSTGDGTVVEAQYKLANGNYVKIRHNSVYTSQYLHMSKIAGGMKPGRRVRQGEVIGYVGSTGLATGPHVCYRFWKNGSQTNHLKEEFPPVDSLKGETLKEFKLVTASQIKQLNSL